MEVAVAGWNSCSWFPAAQGDAPCAHGVCPGAGGAVTHFCARREMSLITSEDAVLSSLSHTHAVLPNSCQEWEIHVLLHLFHTSHICSRLRSITWCCV